MLELILSKPLVVEGICEILTKADVFKFLQDWSKPRDSFFKKLLSCAYCLSVWVSFLICFVFADSSIPLVLEMFLVHRLSNWYHHIYELLFWNSYALKEKHD